MAGGSPPNFGLQWFALVRLQPSADQLVGKHSRLQDARPRQGRAAATGLNIAEVAEGPKQKWQKGSSLRAVVAEGLELVYKSGGGA